MTYEELKTEAKKLGYNLIKANSKPRLKPCVCGCKARHHYYCRDSQGEYRKLVCHKCGREVEGENELEVYNNWNKYIEKEEEFIKEMES